MKNFKDIERSIGRITKHPHPLSLVNLLYSQGSHLIGNLVIVY